MTASQRPDRAALIEAAHDAMQPHRNPVAEPELTRRIRDDATRVLDAVLPRIADAIETDEPDRSLDPCDWPSCDRAKRRAAHLVRSFGQDGEK